jgi:hypothetical protein
MDVVAWLLDSDPAIRWQVMRDLTDAREEDIAAERARVASEGWGARLLALQRQDGQWDGGTPTFTSTAAANWWQFALAGRHAKVRRSGYRSVARAAR